MPAAAQFGALLESAVVIRGVSGEDRCVGPLNVVVAEYPPAGTLEAFAVDDDGLPKVVWKRATQAWQPPAPLGALKAPPGAPMAAAYHPPGGSLECFVASDVDGQRGSGVVVGFFKAQADDQWRWQGPFEPPGQEHVPVPLGAHVAAVHYPPAATLEVLYVDDVSVIRVVWKRANDPWQAPVALAEGALVPPGSPIAVAFHPPGGSLEAFVGERLHPDDDAGALVGFFKAQAVDQWRWQGPFALPGQDHVAVPVGAHLAAVHYPPGGTLEVLYVDARGAVRVLWKRENEPWQSPAQLTADGFATPGAPVAAVYYPDPAGAGDDHLEAFVGGPDAVWLLWKRKDEAWQPPYPLTEPGSSHSGLPLSAATHSAGNTLEVLAGDPTFFARVMWKERNRTWRPCPVAIANRFGVNPSSSVATTRMMEITGGPALSNVGVKGVDHGANTEHLGTHYFFFGDVPRLGRVNGPLQDADLVAFAAGLTSDGVQLVPVVGADGYFAPFTVKRPDVSWTPQTPTKHPRARLAGAARCTCSFSCSRDLTESRCRTLSPARESCPT